MAITVANRSSPSKIELNKNEHLGILDISVNSSPCNNSFFFSFLFFLVEETRSFAGHWIDPAQWYYCERHVVFIPRSDDIVKIRRDTCPYKSIGNIKKKLIKYSWRETVFMAAAKAYLKASEFGKRLACHTCSFENERNRLKRNQPRVDYYSNKYCDNATVSTYVWKSIRHQNCYLLREVQRDRKRQSLEFCCSL